MITRLGLLVALLGILPGLTSSPLAAQDTSRTEAKRLQAKVWVNENSGVYHCPGTRYYGKTKAGTFMTEAAARGKGYRAAGGAGCDPSDPGGTPPGAGPDKVWVNTDSDVYHCPGSRSYGKTKQGKFVTEPAAADEGFRPSGNKKCF